MNAPTDLFAFLLTRCSECGKPNPEPDGAFCSDRCAEAWQGEAVAITRALATEAAHMEGMREALEEAQTTGLWN
jgi:endogenous inhibitor of DNA gyrase (YacG/DUF329 family)